MLRHAATACVLWAAGLCALPLLPAADPPAPPRVYRYWSKADLVDLAASFVSKLDEGQQPFIRFVDLAGVAPERRPRRLQALGLLMNSLSRSDLIVIPQAVPGSELALAWVDLSKYKIDPKAFDRIGLLGSGPAPFPEPYYHQRKASVEDVAYQVWRPGAAGHDAYGRPYQQPGSWAREVFRERRVRVAAGDWLNRATVLGLTQLTRSDFPVYEYRWLAYNALVEPRYHEVLGLDDSEDSAKELAGVDEARAARAGAQVRGAVLFSEVGVRARVLERTPTVARFGRGSWQESYDFLRAFDEDDPLADLNVDRADAHEIIFTLPNGLQGYFLTDGKGKRLDRAAADVAQDNRLKFRDRQVYTAYKCMGCHLAEGGWIDVDDEVRALARARVTLLADALEKRGGRPRDRGREVRQKYLSVDLNELLAQDRATVEACVKAATGGNPHGLSAAAATRELMDSIYEYTDLPVSAPQLALELGVPQADMLRAIEQTPGLAHPFVEVRAGRRARRDQVDPAFGQLARVLYFGGVR